MRFALFDLGFRPFYLLAGAKLASALFRFAAFAAFTVAYVPILSRPRLDGAPG